MKKFIFAFMLMWTAFAFTDEPSKKFCDKEIDLFVDKSSMAFFEFVDPSGVAIYEVRLLFSLFRDHIDQTRLRLRGSYFNHSWWDYPTVSLLRFGNKSDFPKNEGAILKQNRRSGKVDLLINSEKIVKLSNPLPEMLVIIDRYLESRKCLGIYDVEAFSPPL